MKCRCCGRELGTDEHRFDGCSRCVAEETRTDRAGRCWCGAIHTDDEADQLPGHVSYGANA